jgi:NADPH:quinone reductase-like Zn-dependent oxidoreductase
MLIGLEGAGIVVAAGEHAAGLLGQRVAILTLPRGTMAQYLTLAAAACVLIPEQLSIRIARPYS